MTTIAPTPRVLLRCADAAGYGAVSMLDEDAVAPRRKARSYGYGVAFVTLAVLAAYAWSTTSL